MAEFTDSWSGLAPMSEVVRECVDWFKRNWWRTLIISAVSFGVAWVWNVWLMAYKLEGHRVDPGRGGTTATADGHGYNLIYWMLVTTVVFGLFSYGHERGFRTMVQELSRAPQRMYTTLTKHPAVTIGLFLWGASMALLIGSIITQAMAGILGIGFLVAAPSLLANVLNNSVVRIWSAILGNFTPQAAGAAD